MKRERSQMLQWNARVVCRYTLLQIPALVAVAAGLFLLRRWVELPVWVVWLVIGLWAAKDAALFPLTWRAYDTSSRGDAFSLVGAKGIAQEPLAPTGYVRVRGALWQARSVAGASDVAKGTSVEVVEVHGLTLVVRPTPAHASSHSSGG